MKNRYLKLMGSLLTSMCFISSASGVAFHANAATNQVINLLCIGHSFSGNAAIYMADIAKADNVDINVYWLYYGACSLEQHWNFLGTPVYEFNTWKAGTGHKDKVVDNLVDLDFALKYNNIKWDIITFQQSPGMSGVADSYFPYLTSLVQHVKKLQPQARLGLHEIWAYPKDSVENTFVIYNKDQNKMYQGIKYASTAAAHKMGFDLLIPSGQAFQNARETAIGDDLCMPDGLHANSKGQYLAGAVYYGMLSGNDLRKNPFYSASIGSEQQMVLLRQAAYKAVYEYTCKKVEWLKKPDQVKYDVGDSLSIKGGKLKVTYSNNYTAAVDLKDDMVYGFDSSKEGVQNLTVTYGGIANQLQVTVGNVNTTSSKPKTTTSGKPSTGKTSVQTEASTSTETVSNTNTVSEPDESTQLSNGTNTSAQDGKSVNGPARKKFPWGIIFGGLFAVAITVAGVFLFIRRKKECLK